MQVSYVSVSFYYIFYYCPEECMQCIPFRERISFQLCFRRNKSGADLFRIEAVIQINTYALIVCFHCSQGGNLPDQIYIVNITLQAFNFAAPEFRSFYSILFIIFQYLER